MKLLVLSLLLSAVSVQASAATDGSAEHTLRYYQPARTWVEALPVGNGHIGAMVYGGTTHEEIQLNEGSFWGGGPHRSDAPHASDSLARVRQLIFEGHNMEAQRMIDRCFMTGRNGMPYQTLGSLHIEGVKGGLGVQGVQGVQEVQELKS